MKKGNQKVVEVKKKGNKKAVGVKATVRSETSGTLVTLFEVLLMRVGRC